MTLLVSTYELLIDNKMQTVCHGYPAHVSVAYFYCILHIYTVFFHCITPCQPLYPRNLHSLQLYNLYVLILENAKKHIY